MAVSHVESGIARAGTASTTTLTYVIPASVMYGDLCLITVGSERSGLPTVTFPTSGYTSSQSVANGTTNTSEKGWKRMGFNDLGGNITITMAAARRMALAVGFYRGSLDPTFTHGALQVNANGDLATECPNVTPSAADAMLVGMAALYDPIAPFPRTFSPSAGWTERAESGSQSTTTNNGYAYHADKLLSGGSGVSQTGLVITDANEKTIAYPSTAILLPAPLIPDGWDEVRLFRKN